MAGQKSTKKAKTTSWGGVAYWYDTLLAGDDTYQAQVILPNLLRAMVIKKGERVLDLGCGQGFFSRAFFNEGAVVTGVDLSKELIAIAKKNSGRALIRRVLIDGTRHDSVESTARHDSAESEISFFASSAEDLARKEIPFFMMLEAIKK
ncbi:MAG: methyltransferase domain-containing protein [Candidatus Yonathbacteria bacterium]|nr:methyltransferase domain-containing protein [Candidatus Yonathbacteria bacterium]